MFTLSVCSYTCTKTVITHMQISVYMHMSRFIPRVWQSSRWLQITGQLRAWLVNKEENKKEDSSRLKINLIHWSRCHELNRIFINNHKHTHTQKWTHGACRHPPQPSGAECVVRFVTQFPDLLRLRPFFPCSAHKHIHQTYTQPHTTTHTRQTLQPRPFFFVYFHTGSV